MFFIASDHAGLELKQALLDKLGSMNWMDLGTNSTESCDYPDFARLCAEAVRSHPGSLGVLICGTGVGMAIAANKVRGVRAASVSEAFSAKMAREHNQAQILCLGSRVISVDQAIACVEAFVKAKPDTTDRHARRVAKIARLEEEPGGSK
jgi:ribose 5-phosphate isomerase B